MFYNCAKRTRIWIKRCCDWSRLGPRWDKALSRQTQNPLKGQVEMMESLRGILDQVPWEWCCLLVNEDKKVPGAWERERPTGRCSGALESEAVRGLVAWKRLGQAKAGKAEGPGRKRCSFRAFGLKAGVGFRMHAGGVGQRRQPPLSLPPFSSFARHPYRP